MPPAWLRPAALLSPLLLVACAGGGGTRADASASTPVSSADAATVAIAADAVPAEAAPAIAAEGQAPAMDAALPADVAMAPPPAAAGDAPTEAELDYAAIYGPAPYDPVADPTLPTPVQMQAAYDPWENWNRKVHRFNNAVDRAIAKPLARTYVKVVPRPVRLGVTNFFNNLGQPVSALNALLQGKPGQAGASVGRFLVNSTVGIGGLFDPATRMRIPNRSEDFGQTLGVWGWKNSRYVELPLFGPRTLRDSFGLIGDAPLSPIRQVESDEVRYFLQGLQLVDTRVQLMPLDSLREGAADEYALIRDGWMQRRNYQIHGDSKRSDGQDGLPDYLLEDDDNPMVPVDVMPIVPLSPTP